MKRLFAIVDCRIPARMERRLNILGFTVVTLPSHPRLGAAVGSHTDMLIARVGREYISPAEYCEVAPHVFTDLSQLLGGTGYSITLTADELGEVYPDDCKMNVLAMGKYLFARETASSYILERARAEGMTVVPVKQGYPACTVLALNERQAITADGGMARAMREVGIEVTEIENGDISLPPYEYGFIGGCAGVYKDKVYFLGDPRTHRDYEKIRAACESAGLTAVALSDGGLIDLGGIIIAEGDLK